MRANSLILLIQCHRVGSESLNSSVILLWNTTNCRVAKCNLTLMRLATGLSKLNNQRQLHTRIEVTFIARRIGTANALRKVPARNKRRGKIKVPRTAGAGGRS
jgi:hypothetical protein